VAVVAAAAAPADDAAALGTATALGHPAGAAARNESLGPADAWTEAVILAGAKPVAWYGNGPAAGGPAVTRHDLGEGRAWYVSARTDARATAAVLAAACDSAGVAAPARPVEPHAPAGPLIPAEPPTPSGLPVTGHSSTLADPPTLVDSPTLADPLTPFGPPDIAEARDAQPGVAAESPTPLGSSNPLAPVGDWPRDLELVRRTDGQRRFITLINHGETPVALQLDDRIVTVPAGDVRVITGRPG
jgi:hypothetical protein